MNVRVAGDCLGFAFREPRAGFAEAWRDLDRAVWRWVMAHGGDEATATAGAWASHAEGQGHTALPLTPDEGAASGVAAQIDVLRRSPFVTVAGDAGLGRRPFVLDGDHFYLLRNFRAEVAVAQALIARREAACAPLCPLSDEDLRALFNGSWSDAEEMQRDAVRQAAGRRLMVLTGGPGTGKTTTVLRMLLGLSREHHATSGAMPKVRIAAPTGKAAQRLSESLRQGAERLRAGDFPLSEDWLPHLDCVLAADSGTVHRMLGSRGRHGGYAFHAGEPLPADVVVVDEASMLDLGLLRALLSSLREDAVLVLVGDADQLTSVGTGSVMMDIVRAMEETARGDFVRLTHCFRADASLVPINESVRAGDPEAFRAAWSLAVDAGRAHSHEVADRLRLNRRLVAWAQRLKDSLREAEVTLPLCVGDGEAITKRLAVLRRQQLLCALREGPFGSLQAAAFVAGQLRRWDALAHWSGREWYPGRCVIVTRNDPAARLFNGDVGICVRVSQGERPPLLQVLFESAPDGPSFGQAGRLFDPNTLPVHEDAFALTIHKSQGSEYDHVAVLLPPGAESPLLVRQTLYTGLSRAKTSVDMWSTEASREKAIGSAMQRHGRLAMRIASD